MRTCPRSGRATTLPTRTSSLGFSDALAVDADVALFDERLGERAAFGQADAVQEAVDPHLRR